ncbi:MAG: DUF5110 domain-containing protein [Bacteroidales bacterium]|nr:DUF5110 domain-containing protein [Bacteroidales bacterium]
MKRIFMLIVVMCAYITGVCAADNQNNFTVNTDKSTVQVKWYTPSSVNIVKSVPGYDYKPLDLVVIADQMGQKISVKENADSHITSSKELTVKVDKHTGVVTFATLSGKILLQENGEASLKEMMDVDVKAYTVGQSFRLEADEAIYGLGILQNGKMSQRGTDKVLCPNNTEDGIPFMQSSKGYGLYWDNYSATHFTDKDNVMTFESETGGAVDYYFMYGKNADGVVAQMRQLSGDVPMFPLWVYGFHQSKERYKSQKETCGVVHKYRENNIPLDGIIQDWQYWGNNYLWNAMEFMNEEFPDPKAMMKDIHDNHAHCSISIWSSFGPMTKPYKQLEEKGLLFDIATWPQSGISHIWPPRMDYPSGVRVYDCYSAEARDIYWNNLKRLFDLDLDAWWMDSTEPDHFDHKPQDFDKKTAMGSYRSVRCAYPLMTVGGVYDHQRSVSSAKRLFILTRSGFAGQQRYGCNVWSGDVNSTWEMLRSQVPAGLNFSLTGNPNFNSDLGGFFAGAYNGTWKGQPGYKNPAYHELYVRWMQYGVFTPMMRSHGADVPREVYLYAKEGESLTDSPVTSAMIAAIELRYKLLPYIYSTAWQVTHNRSTFMRALVMDFANDKKCLDINDEFMMGQAILATPILQAQYTPEVIKRDTDANAGWAKDQKKQQLDMENVDFTVKKENTFYLPAGAVWYDFELGNKYNGGQDVTLETTLASNPFFVKGGSILPLGPDVQYSTEKKWDDLEIRVYAGADGKFVLYEDEFDNYNYEQGKYTETEFKWDDKKRTLTIMPRRGAYEGAIENRNFRVLLINGAQSHKVRGVSYSGKRVTVKL